MASEDFVYVVYEKNEDGIIGLIEAHSSNDNAKAASKALKSKGSSNVEVKKLELKSSAEAAAPKVKAYVSFHLGITTCLTTQAGLQIPKQRQLKRRSLRSQEMMKTAAMTRPRLRSRVPRRRARLPMILARPCQMARQTH